MKRTPSTSSGRREEALTSIPHRRWSLLTSAATVGLGTFLALSLRASEPPHALDPRELSAGDATVFDNSRQAFSLPVPGLTDAQKSAFAVGNSFFNLNWVAAPASTAARDGLGPLFNARSCSACHLHDGRSRPPEAGGAMSTMLLRVSVPGTNAHGGPQPHPIYGGQIQGRALPDVPPEADVVVDYEPVRGAFADGEVFELRRPRYSLRNLGYGPVATSLQMSPRVAPAVIGLGLLEAVPVEQLVALADPRDRDGDGISGKLNQVWNAATQRHEPGRFGWKAEQPTVRQQVAGALNGDMGLTTSLFPAENHSPAQTAAARLPSGGSPEVSDQILENVTFYSRVLAVPARRSVDDQRVLRGEELFRAAKCASCHREQFTTGEVPGLPQLSRQTIRPYTDLLLHDLGEGLSDNRPAFVAEGREWRTPPLWGIGLVPKVNGHSFLLHDGRARNLSEAILWHGGEAEKARKAFRQMSRADREALVKFLESL